MNQFGSRRCLVLVAGLAAAPAMLMGCGSAPNPDVGSGAQATSDTSKSAPSLSALAATVPLKGKSVNPNSVKPAAILEDTPWFQPIPYKCWEGAGLGAPVGTAITCYASLVEFVAGDGSLASDPNGQPDTYVSGFTCPGGGGFTVFDQATVTWAAARYYNSDSNEISHVRSETYTGKIYNGNTGKSVSVQSDDVYLGQQVPPDGTENNLYITLFGNDFTAFKGTKILAATPQSGYIYFTPDQNSIIKEIGIHPLDDWYNGQTSELDAVCAALN